MIAYEFYKYNPQKGYELLGTLSERRNNPERISRESVMDWFEKVFGDSGNSNEITFIPVKMS
jgi:hypothetical protein